MYFRSVAMDEDPLATVLQPVQLEKLVVGSTVTVHIDE